MRPTIDSRQECTSKYGRNKRRDLIRRDFSPPLDPRRFSETLSAFAVVEGDRAGMLFRLLSYTFQDTRVTLREAPFLIARKLNRLRAAPFSVRRLLRTVRRVRSAGRSREQKMRYNYSN